MTTECLCSSNTAIYLRSVSPSEDYLHLVILQHQHTCCTYMRCSMHIKQTILYAENMIFNKGDAYVSSIPLDSLDFVLVASMIVKAE